MSDKTSQQNDAENRQLPPLAKRFLWADSTDAVERVILGLGILCLVLFVLDFIVHRHAYAPGEGLPGFYAVVGFGAFTLIVLGAKQLRRLILRNEQYYSPFSVDAEDYPSQGLETQSHEELLQAAAQQADAASGTVTRASNVDSDKPS